MLTVDTQCHGLCSAWSGLLLLRSSALTKWAQWASVRNDLFPDALCRALSVLQYDAPTHAFHHTERALAQAAAGGCVHQAAGEEGRETGPRS